MLTLRGWWFFLVVLLLIAFARLGVTLPPSDLPRLAPVANNTLGVLALTLGLWFVWERLIFAIRAHFLTSRLRADRELRDNRGPVATLWVRKSFEVRTSLHLPSGLNLPFVRVTDRLPYRAERTAGENRYEGPLEIGQPLHLNYTLRCPEIGRVRFEGMRVELSDYHGFFYAEHFLREAAEYRVLPPLTDAEGHAASVKRHNLLPPPGIHRLRRPGTGSELLDLRDYLPGDPPKTIAWKASARRDRLITKEFESEVPLRCTLFVDTSNAVRAGKPGQSALNKLVEIAASVAQATAGARDLTGLCLFDDKSKTYVRPARGARHLARLINLLVDAAALPASTAEAGVQDLLRESYALAREVYPELMRQELNHVPVWLPWLWPQRAYTIRKPTWGDRLNEWLPVLLWAYLWVATAIVAYGAEKLRSYLFPSRQSFPDPAPVLLSALVIAGFIVVLVFTLVRLPTHFFAAKRRLYRMRKQLAALLSARYGLAPGGLSVLMEDEERFVLQLQRFLGEHHVPYTATLLESLDRSVFTSPKKAGVLAEALLRAVSKGHDNELFVLMVDLLGVPDKLDPLLRAVRVAIARHHRVMVICPWPQEVAPPQSSEEDQKRARNGEQEALAKRLQGAYRQLRRTFARMGVPIVCAQGGDPVRLILDRLDRLRMLGRKR